jgi:hypothetical protein
MVCIQPVVLLLSDRQATNVGCISNPYLVAKLSEHVFKPLAISATLKPDDYVTLKLRVKLSNVLVTRIVT